MRFLRCRNHTHPKVSHARNLDKLIEQKILILRTLHVVEDRMDAFPLFLAARATFAQYNDARMGSNVKELDEVSCVRRNHRKIVIHTIFPDNPLSPTREAN